MRILAFIIYKVSRFVQRIALMSDYIKTNQEKKIEYLKLLTIQAGSEGLKGVFYEELVNSAKETFGDTKVHINSIDRKISYISQTASSIKNEKSMYIFLDPRTLHSNPIIGIFQAFISSLILSKNSIKPIVFLTDASVIKWRLMSIIWSASEGICLMLMKPEKLKKMFPHSRCYGPVFIPISRKRRYKTISDTLNYEGEKKVKFGFQGSIYPERKMYLDEIEKCSAKLNFDFCIHEKNQSLGNDVYWKFISDHDVVVTTTVQTNLEKNLVDHINENQMVFRISEVIALGKILLTTPVDGIERFFIPNKDFIQIENTDTVIDSCKISIEKIESSNPLTVSGARAKYERLIDNNCFWRIAGIGVVGNCKYVECACLN